MLNPYKLLEGVSSFFPEESQAAVRQSESSTDELEEGDAQINNGGAALWAYGLLQFCQQEPEKKTALVEALYRYCELDTLAMVFVWEYFNEMTTEEKNLGEQDKNRFVCAAIAQWEPIPEEMEESV